MLQGHMSLQRFDARGLRKAEIDAGIKAMGLDRFLETVHKNGHWEGKNRILVPFARSLYYADGHSTSNGGWLNAPDPGNYYNTLITGHLWCVLLATTSTEPAVTESYSTQFNNGNTNYIPFPDRCVNGYWKRFDSDGPVDVQVYKDAGGRELAKIRQTFMWYPGECTSSQIRSVCVYGGYQHSYTVADPGFPTPTYYDYRVTRLARWRVKDAGGVPVTLVKLDQEVLLLQYTLTMYTR